MTSAAFFPFLVQLKDSVQRFFLEPVEMPGRPALVAAWSFIRFFSCASLAATGFWWGRCIALWVEGGGRMSTSVAERMLSYTSSSSSSYMYLMRKDKTSFIYISHLPTSSISRLHQSAPFLLQLHKLSKCGIRAHILPTSQWSRFLLLLLRFPNRFQIIIHSQPPLTTFLQMKCPQGRLENWE